MGFLELKAKKDKFGSDREKLRKEIKELTEELEESKKQANKAALDGDVNLYMSIKEQIKTIEAEAEVKQVQLGAMTGKGVSKEEIEAGWREYREEYNKQFQHTMESLDKARTQYLQAVKNVILTQNEGLEQQKRFGALLGYEPGMNHQVNENGGTEVFNLIDKLPMRTFPAGSLQDSVTIAYKGHVYRPDVGVYLAYNPNSLAVSVLEGLVPVSKDRV